MKNNLRTIYFMLLFILSFYVKSNFGFDSKNCSCVCQDGTICAQIKFIWFSQCQCRKNGCPKKYIYNGNIPCNGHGRFLPNFGHLSIFYPFDVIVWRYILDYAKKILSMLLGFTLQWHVLNIGSVGLL